MNEPPHWEFLLLPIPYNSIMSLNLLNESEEMSVSISLSVNNYKNNIFFIDVNFITKGIIII